MKYAVVLALLLGFSLGFALPARAVVEGGAKPAHLSASEQVDVARVQDYLNELKTLAAKFIQVDDAGGMMTGRIAIERPGKMRVTYDPPSKDFIIADGSNVHIWNDDLQEQTNVDEGSSLAEFILRDPVRLNGDVTVTRFQRFPAKIEVTLVQTDDPAAGSLTLVFEDKPLMLRQWRVVDPQGRTTGVSLQDVHTDVTFPAPTFSFVPPNFGKGAKSNMP
jgi:outer membrane lipoprotein-sorting protein